MVALVPAALDAARLAVAGGEDPDELHLTLFNLGAAADYDPDVRAAIVGRLRSLVEDVLRPDYDLPMVADGFALQVFNPGSANECVVLGVTGGDLEAVWDLAADALDQLEAEHGGFELPEQHKPWTPHITLVYTGDPAGRIAEVLDRAGPVTFDRLRVAFAGEYTDVALAPVTATKRFDPHQLRDPGGEDGGQWVSNPASLLRDALRLAGKIDLGPDEKLAGTDKISGEDGTIRVAAIDRGGKRRLRIGIGDSVFGSRGDEAGPWTAGPDPTAKTNAQRRQLRDEVAALNAEWDRLDANHDANAARISAIEKRLAELDETDTGDVHPGGFTADVDAADLDRFRAVLPEALAKAAEVQSKNDAYWAEHDRLTAEHNRILAAVNRRHPRVWADEEAAQAQALAAQIDALGDAPEHDYEVLAQGKVPGGWADIHYRFELDDLGIGPQLLIGAVPHDNPDLTTLDDVIHAEQAATFDVAETKKLLRLLDKFVAGGSGKRGRGAASRKFDPHEPRDLQGQWTDGVPGDADLNLEGFDLISEIEGSFGTLAMGVDSAGDVRMAFTEGGKNRALDLGIDEVAELGDALERLQRSRIDLPDGADQSGVYDDDRFGFDDENKVELYGSGVISVVFGAYGDDPYTLDLDPPYQADPADPEDTDFDDVQDVLDAIDDVLNHVDTDAADTGSNQKSGWASMHRKSLNGLRVKSATKGEISAVFCTFDVVDHDGDIVLKGAIPAGKEVVISAYNHASWGPGAVPVGKGVIRIAGNEAVLDGQFFLDTTAGADTFNALKQLGALAEYSWGFDVLDGTPNQHGGRDLKSVDVHEVSPVLKGASIGTRTLALKQRADVVRHKRAIPAHETATVDRPWDAAAMEKALDTDRPSDLRTVYAWVDPDGDPEVKSSYRFPHHHGVKGPANLRASLAGIAVLNGARGGTDLSPEDRAAVYEHLASHLRDADREPPQLRTGGPAAKFNDELLETLAGVSGLLDSAQRVVALRASKGKSLSKVNTELLVWIRDDLKRLDALLTDNPGTDDDGPSDDEIASTFMAALARVHNI